MNNKKTALFSHKENSVLSARAPVLLLLSHISVGVHNIRVVIVLLEQLLLLLTHLVHIRDHWRLHLLRGLDTFDSRDELILAWLMRKQNKYQSR